MVTRLFLILLLLIPTGCITVTVGGRDANTKQSSERKVDVDVDPKEEKQR